MHFSLPIMMLVVALLSGCSSIVSERKYLVDIASEPSRADITLKNRNGTLIHTGTTPISLMLNASSGFYKGETYTLTLNKVGYIEKTVIIDSNLDEWYFGNILIVSFLGMLVVDPVTGAMFELPERSYTVLDKKVSE
ncbi:hypothetical protein [Psychromonas sp. SP041]|uniref:hypothetical protein n=1 Tax=Psychromonas sp. SP041 TaxID=1365007 RepID=UPI000424DABE|nr:hypothetical protein [Psychromonas sp. SP041]